MIFVFFFSSRRRHTRWPRDWSSDVCSSDLRVNIEAIQGASREGEGFIQFVPNDPDKAARTLDAAGIAYSKREVLVVRVLDEPGMLSDVALVMSKAGINIDSVYVTTHGYIVLGVD